MGGRRPSPIRPFPPRQGRALRCRLRRLCPTLWLLPLTRRRAQTSTTKRSLRRAQLRPPRSVGRSLPLRRRAPSGRELLKARPTVEEPMSPRSWSNPSQRPWWATRTSNRNTRRGYNRWETTWLANRRRSKLSSWPKTVGSAMTPILTSSRSRARHPASPLRRTSCGVPASASRGRRSGFRSPRARRAPRPDRGFLGG